eukprot:jgi/Hompol1/5166/HPOL_004217-RA
MAAREQEYKRLASRGTHWVPTSQLSLYDPSNPVVIGIPQVPIEGYFRAFTQTMSLPLEEPRLARLLPHRFRRSIRVYGASPMVLLSKSVTYLAPIQPLATGPLENNVFKKANPLQPIEAPEEPRRAGGPEIEPQLGEDGEFGPLSIPDLSLGKGLSNESLSKKSSTSQSTIKEIIEPVQETAAVLPQENIFAEPESESDPVGDANASNNQPPEEPVATSETSDLNLSQKRTSTVSDTDKSGPPPTKTLERRGSKPKTMRRSSTHHDQPITRRHSRKSVVVETEKIHTPQAEVVAAIKLGLAAADSQSNIESNALETDKDMRPAMLQVKKPHATAIVPHHQRSVTEEPRELDRHPTLRAVKIDHSRRQSHNASHRSEANKNVKEMLEANEEDGPTSKGFLTSVMKNMSVIDSETRGRLQVVFELVNDDSVDQQEFVVIAALAERMTLLDQKVRLSFYDTDFKKLEQNIRQYRQLFTVYTEEDGSMTYDDLNILLKSSGSSEAQINEIASLLKFQDAAPNANVGFLDFLSYVPFFAKLHENIVNNPFGDASSSIETDGSGI